MQPGDTASKLDRATFVRLLQQVLSSLYDPMLLRKSPLLTIFDLTREVTPGMALQSTLTEAIETLHPGDNVPADTRAWRIYQILRRRYTEQAPQRQVALDLGLSVRQLQREESLSREMLAEHLWEVYDLDRKTVPVPATENWSTKTRTQELEEFRKSVPAQLTDVGVVMEEVLDTIRPLLALTHVSLDLTLAEALPRLWIQASLLKQAILNIISMVIHSSSGGAVRISITQWERSTIASMAQSKCIAIDIVSPHSLATSGSQEQMQGVKITQQLVESCGGELQIMAAGGEQAVSIARLVLPGPQEATVLVIDDNADTRQLYQRYLTGSRYRFVGAPDAEQGMALAAELAPQIIVLDVMMPGQDGWMLLGQLRKDAKTCQIPVIVCTILPHEQLAFALGAADFIRKPVDRSTFLTMLDAQLEGRR